jgi:hypothetical protein
MVLEVSVHGYLTYLTLLFLGHEEAENYGEEHVIGQNGSPHCIVARKEGGGGREKEKPLCP